MKILFDTSVLVAAIVAEHPHYSIALPWLQRVQAEQIEGFVSNHTLAELYAILTRLPQKPKIKPELAQRLVQENLAKFHKIVLTTEDYQDTVARMVSLNLPGGGIYDALIAQAAIKANVDVLLTLNANDFTRLGEDIARLVQSPN
ncbi:PIN domain-containing protein [Nostoc spongiaeforme FACHB-130]|uniref:Ribonuclease VapC n=1 Tax=Nostoc spongiaeforme FACHB-130 TaxID=1357510 RepID=A0ABR8G4J2_9NOSO|nr:PIN domain-containing protein [Nostoc spongiaeforme]MBD2598094.1 PIN domain-containing protein [Nostoc spongiaeforme FACHB-130]